LLVEGHSAFLTPITPYCSARVVTREQPCLLSPVRNERATIALLLGQESVAGTKLHILEVKQIGKNLFSLPTSQ
jgi:hypothetical protein